MADEDPQPRPIDTRNRVSVPPDVRDALKLEPGDYVAFTVEGKKAVMRKVEWTVKA